MSGGPDRTDALPDVDELIAVLADAIDRDPAGLAPESRVVDVCADSLDLYCAYVALDRWVPGFLLPRQLDLTVATLADVHHYLLVRFEQRRA